MKKTRIASVIAVVFLLSVLLQSQALAGDDGAFVLTHKDAFVVFFLAGGWYTGPATLVLTPNGRIEAQAATIFVDVPGDPVFDGDPVSETTRIRTVFGSPWGPVPVLVVLTPSGHGNVSGHGFAF